MDKVNQIEHRKLRKISTVKTDQPEEKKQRYYNNPQNKNVRERREIKGAR